MWVDVVDVKYVLDVVPLVQGEGVADVLVETVGVVVAGDLLEVGY